MRYILFFSITTDYFVKGHKKSRRVGTLLLAVRNDFGTQLLQLAAISNKVRKWNVTRFLIEIVESFALKKHSFIQITGVNYTRALNIKFIQCSIEKRKVTENLYVNAESYFSIRLIILFQGAIKRKKLNAVFEFRTFLCS